MFNQQLDPVCGMVLDPYEALAQSFYDSRVYHFCSQECKQKFDREPEKYLEGQPEPLPER